MAWSSTFLAALSDRRYQLRYRIETYSVHQEPGAVWVAASYPTSGAALRLAPDVDVQGSTLSTRGWTTTFGSWSVSVVGDLSALAKITRGTICRLLAGVEGMADIDYAPIAIGQLRNVRGRPPAYRLEFVDLYAALTQRLQTAYSVSLLFDGVGSTTTLSAAYAVGDTTLEVASTSAFSRETGGSGALLITPTSGDPFYLTYTGTATGPTRFTGVSATGQMGTTAVATAAGDVREVAYLAGHPLDIARKVLCSRDGSNGAYDTLPGYWGLAVRDALIDHTDIAQTKTAMAPASGSYAWAYAQPEVVDSAWSWLQSFLSPAGCFFGVRQGQLTIRCARSMAAATPALAITDRDIEEVEDHELFASSHPPEYHGLLVNPGSGSGSSAYDTDVATLPYERDITYDLADRLFSNVTDVTASDLARLSEDARRVPERLVLRCAGLRLAQLVVGDVIELTTRQAWARNRQPYSARRALVVEVSTQWAAASVRVALQVYPEDEAVFS